MKRNLMILAVCSFVLSIGLVAGCKKNEGNYLLEGIITDETTGQPMSDFSLAVSTQEAGATAYLTHSTIVTDANGKYTVEVDRGQLDKIKIAGEKENYFPIEIVVPVSTLTIDQAYAINQGTTAKSWARLIFVHESGDPNAVLEYTKNDGKQDCFECCPKTTQTYTGFVNDTVYCINDGNTNYSYTYLVVGVGSINTKSCYTPAFDTGQVVLNY